MNQDFLNNIKKGHLNPVVTSLQNVKNLTANTAELNLELTITSQEKTE